MITPEDYKEIPELDDEFFANAIHEINGVPVTRQTRAARKPENPDIPKTEGPG